jgi:hypothetical protein
MNFGVRNFAMKDDPQKTLMFECHLSRIPLNEEL